MGDGIGKGGLARRILLRFPRLYYELVFALPGLGFSAFNFGYAPAPDAVRAAPEAKRQPYQIALYDRALNGFANRPAPGDVLVEISSGKGAGLAYAARVTGAAAIALERSSSGRAHASRAFGLDARHCEAPVLPLEDASADRILSIEAAHNYFDARFAAEVARVLRPGGEIVIADCPLAPYARQVERATRLLEGAGLSVEPLADITPNVIEACRADTLRFARFLKLLPGPLRRAMMEALGCEGSGKFESFVRGARGYYLLRAVKPA